MSELNRLKHRHLSQASLSSQQHRARVRAATAQAHRVAPWCSEGAREALPSRDVFVAWLSFFSAALHVQRRPFGAVARMQVGFDDGYATKTSRQILVPPSLEGAGSGRHRVAFPGFPTHGEVGARWGAASTRRALGDRQRVAIC